MKEREIYSGPEQGIYTFKNFTDFMEYKVKATPAIEYRKGDNFVVYNDRNKNVVIVYHRLTKIGRIEVIAVGGTKEVSDLEKKFSLENQRIMGGVK